MFAELWLSIKKNINKFKFICEYKILNGIFILVLSTIFAHPDIGNRIYCYLFKLDKYFSVVFWAVSRVTNFTVVFFFFIFFTANKKGFFYIKEKSIVKLNILLHLVHNICIIIHNGKCVYQVDLVPFAIFIQYWTDFYLILFKRKIERENLYFHSIVYKSIQLEAHQQFPN